MKETNLVISRQVTTVVKSGKDEFAVSKGTGGVNLTVNGKTNVVIPVGKAGDAVVMAIAELLTVSEDKPKQKRHRRTKAEIAAERAGTV